MSTRRKQTNIKKDNDKLTKLKSSTDTPLKENDEDEPVDTDKIKNGKKRELTVNSKKMTTRSQSLPIKPNVKPLKKHKPNPKIEKSEGTKGILHPPTSDLKSLQPDQTLDTNKHRSLNRSEVLEKMLWLDKPNTGALSGVRGDLKEDPKEKASSLKLKATNISVGQSNDLKKDLKTESIASEDIYVLNDKTPFTPLGWFTLVRTYARRLNENNVNSPIENWKQVLTRVIEACNSQLGCKFTDAEKKRLFYLMYHLKCLPGGRFLWQLGTRTVHKLGLASLQNCAFRKMDHAVVVSKWIMDFLMLGSGCGSNVQEHNINKIPVPQNCKLTRTDFLFEGVEPNWIVPYSKSEWGTILQYSKEKLNVEIMKLEEIDLTEYNFLTNATQYSRYFDFLQNPKNNKVVPEITGYDKKTTIFLRPKDRKGWIAIMSEHVARTKNIVSIKIPTFEKKKIFVTPDSREGWVELLGEMLKHQFEPSAMFNKISLQSEEKNNSNSDLKDGSQVETGDDDELTQIMDSHFSQPVGSPIGKKSSINSGNSNGSNKSDKDEKKPKEISGTEFIYSTTLIRPKGDPIRTFGGTASGPKELCEGLIKINKILNLKIGQKTDSVDWVDIICLIAEIVVSGNVRRSSLIIIGDAHDIKFLNAKNFNKGVVPNWRHCANLSVACDDIKTLPEEFWEGYNGNGECYGLVNIKLCKTMGRIGETQYPDPDVEGFNPCFSGKTLIAVADGRHAVSIKQLAKEGKDVPVYSYDKKTGKVQIKWGRNPRITGKNQKMLRVHFDDKSFIDVTPNHKFYTMNKKSKRADELKKGDSLPRFKKYNDGYIRVYTNINTTKRKSEHRMITKFHKKKEYKKLKQKGVKNGACKTHNVIVHHKDEDKTNNHIDNLEIMTFADHNKEHYGNGQIAGDKNPMYGKKHSDATKELIGEKTKERCEDEDYLKRQNKLIKKGMKKNGVSEKISQARIKTSKEKRKEKSKEIKKEADKSDIKIRIGKKYHVYAIKECETCDKEFETKWKRREIAYCSNECNNKGAKAIKSRTKGKRKTHKKKSEGNLHNQIMIYKDLEEELERQPLKKEWEKACKEKQVPYRLQTNTPNPNVCKSFGDLSERAKEYNHRVVKIEKLEKTRTVYNITVDKNHTVGIITDINHNSWNGIYADNCGEQTLVNCETCCLGELLLPNIESMEEMKECASFIYRICKQSLLLPCHNKETEAIVHKNMRMGIGITGYMQAPEAKKAWAPDVYKYLREYDVKYSKERNIPISIKLTTVKPSGTLSTMCNVSPGCHPFVSDTEYYFRRMRIDSQSFLVQKAIDSGIHCEPRIGFDKKIDPNTNVLRFVEKVPTGAPIAKNVRAGFFLEKIIKRLGTDWSDNGVSASCYYALHKREIEILSAEVKVLQAFPLQKKDLKSSNPLKKQTFDRHAVLIEEQKTPFLDFKDLRLEIIQLYTTTLKQLEEEKNNHAVIELVQKLTAKIKHFESLCEIKDVRSWLMENYNNNVKAISCFPKSAEVHKFDQMPYEGISEEVYLAEMTKIHLDPHIDPKYFRKAGVEEDTFIGEGECSKGSCPLR